MSPVKSIVADRVGIVVDVGRMQPRFAAVGARPNGLRPDQADAGAGSNCNAPPSRVEKNVSMYPGGEEVRRAVRPVEDADLPRVRQRGA